METSDALLHELVECLFINSNVVLPNLVVEIHLERGDHDASKPYTGVSNMTGPPDAKGVSISRVAHRYSTSGHEPCQGWKKNFLVLRPEVLRRPFLSATWPRRVTLMLMTVANRRVAAFSLSTCINSCCSCVRVPIAGRREGHKMSISPHKSMHAGLVLALPLVHILLH